MSEAVENLDKWINVPLEQLAIDPKTIAYGVLKPGEFDPGGAPLIRIKDLKNDQIDPEGLHYITKELHEEFKRTWLEGGEVLVSIQGTIGRVAIVPEILKGANISRTLAVIRPAKPEFAKWILYFLKSPQAIRQMGEVVTGSTRDSWNLRDLRKLDVPLAPPEQQKRIVAKVEELFSHIDAGISALKKAKQLLKQYRQSVLKAAVTGELTKEWREANKDKLEPASQLLERILKERRQKWKEQQLAQFKAKGKLPKNDKWMEKYKEPASSKDPIPECFPDSWAWLTVEQLNPPDRPCAYGVLQPGSDFKNGISLIRVGDIRDGKIVYDDVKKIDPKIAEKYPRTKLQGGEVLISLVGAIGRTAVVPPELAGANTARAVGMMALLEQAMPNWVELWFRNPEKIQEMTSKSHEVARKTLNLEDVRSSSVAVPPYGEQKEIVEKVEEKFGSIRRIENEIDMQLKKSEKNKLSILVTAFSGRLVEQNEDDEDAKTLLARIREEQDSNNGKKKITRKKVKTKKEIQMSTRKVIDILKETNKELNSLELFEAAGYSHDMQSEKIEKFYLDLKSAVDLPNVEVTEVTKSGIKQDNKFKYKG